MNKQFAKTFVKDPDAVLDYQFDWQELDRPWLSLGEEIVASTISLEVGATDLTIDNTTHDATSATVWLSGGEVGKDYEVTNHITTNQGRQDDRTMLIQVRER